MKTCLVPKLLILTDDYITAVLPDGMRNTYAYGKYRELRHCVRKFMNVTVTDIPLAFFSSSEMLSHGKKISLIDSVEISLQNEILVRSRFNSVYTFFLEKDSLIKKLYTRLTELLPLADSGEPNKREFETSGWGRPEFFEDREIINNSHIKSADVQLTENPVGDLYSISLMKDGADYIVKTSNGFKKGNMSTSEYNKMKLAITSFLSSFKSFFDEMQYKRLLFLCNTCKRCGECCKVYEVEANVFEQEYIAEFLGISHQELITKYLHENRFSWNEFSMMLNKVNGYNTPCVFQGICDDGSYGCKIHSVRPEVCRKFLPSLGKCVMNGKLPDSTLKIIDCLVSFTVTEQSIIIDTELTNGNRINPVLLDIDDSNKGFLPLTDYFAEFARDLNRHAAL